MEKSQTMRFTPGSSVNSISKRARSTWACSPGATLNVYYKNARIKQYHKENCALRTETTINNTYDLGRRLRNLPKLRAIGFAANRRLLEVERLSHNCMLAEQTFQSIDRPIETGGQRASGLRFGDRASTLCCRPSSS